MYAGIDFRTACRDGVALGQKLASGLRGCISYLFGVEGQTDTTMTNGRARSGSGSLMRT